MATNDFIRIMAAHHNPNNNFNKKIVDSIKNKLDAAINSCSEVSVHLMLVFFSHKKEIGSTFPSALEKVGKCSVLKFFS